MMLKMSLSWGGDTLQDCDKSQLIASLSWQLWQLNAYTAAYDVYRHGFVHTNVYKYLSSHLKGDKK